MRILNFSNEECETIWNIVASILHLGNVEFNCEDDQIEIISNCKNEIKLIASLLDVNENDLIKTLCHRVIAAGGQVISKQHNKTEASFGRDAFAKAIYERLFNKIVERINDAIRVDSSASKNNISYNKSGTVIGVLDIYGFDKFDNTSFEQFCINYCNEKLQQLFIELVLKQEQEEYKKEGIEWKHVDYFNNAIICNLVEENHKGILAILDEACLTVGKVTDCTLLESMDNKLATHQHYTSRRLSPKDKSLEHQRDFRVKHYAGDVTYSVVGFLEKNKDTLFQDFKRLLFNSSNRIIKGKITRLN